jgi:hypothetical protein
MPRKLTSKALGTGSVTTTQLDSSVNNTINNVTINTVFTGNSITVPAGTTAQRPASPTTGMIRYNTDIGLIEQYNSAGWQGVDIPPVITNISGTINTDSNSTITINGSNFKTGCIVYIEGAGVSNTPRALTTTFVSSSQLTVATNAESVNYVGGASFDVRVTNPSGLSSTLNSAGSIDRDPIWSTSAGNVATITDLTTGSHVTLSASDPDGTSITYSVTSGSLPVGVSLDSSTGVLSGDPANISNSTTYSFDVTATSNSQSAVRSFNIIVNPGRDGTSSARATTPHHLRNTLGITTNGVYWIRALNTYNGVTQTQAVQAYIHFNKLDSKDWVLMMDLNQSGNQSGSISTSLTPQDCIGYSIPWKGFNLEKDGTAYYSYFGSHRAYNERGTEDTNTVTGGNKDGYRVFLGKSGGHGFYTTAQSPCSWSEGPGSVGAGYDGSCGTYPTSLRMGFGNGGGNPQYSLSTGTWRSWVWMDNAV